MEQGWYIDGERASASEARRVLRGAAGRTWAPSDELERMRDELRADGYTDVDGVAVEFVAPDASWDERGELVELVTTLDAGPELRALA